MIQCHFLLVLLLLTGMLSASPEINILGGPTAAINGYQNVLSGASPVAAQGTHFGNVPLGQSKITFFRVQNKGSMTLTYSAGLNNSFDFSVGNLGSSLSSTDPDNYFTITFTPSEVGTKTATLTFTHNDPDGNESPYIVNLRGTGVGPEISLASEGTLVPILDGHEFPNAADGTAFGDVDLLDSPPVRGFRITNTGTADLTFLNMNIDSGRGFSLLNAPAPATTITPGNWEPFLIQFEPNAVGARTAEIRINSTDASRSPFTFRVSAAGVINPDIRIMGGDPRVPVPSGSTTPLAINGTRFPSIEVGELEFRSFSIYNDGSDNLTYNMSLDSPGSHFIFEDGNNSSGTISVQSGQARSIRMFFIPRSRGTHNATISVTSNDPDESPYLINLQGRGLAPDLKILGNSIEIENGDDSPRVSDHTNFLNVPVDGPAVRRTFEIKNDGDLTLTFLTAGISPEPGFFITDAPPTNTLILPGASATFDVGFDPSTDGQVTASVTVITTDENNTPFTFDVTANGIGDPELRLIQNSNIITANQRIDYGERELGSPITKSFTLRNIGNGTLNYSASVSNSQFRIGNLGATLQPNQGNNSNDEFTVTFDPTSRGDKIATVTFTSNDPDQNSFTFIVEGKAIDPEIDLFGGDLFNIPISNLDEDPRLSDGTDFGTAEVGALGIPKTFSIVNSGEVDLQIVSSNLEDETHFTINPFPFSSIKPNKSKLFQIAFEPQSAGRHTTTVKIVNSDHDENPYTFSITGIGIDDPPEPEIDLFGGADLDIEIANNDQTPDITDGTDFGRIDIGTSQPVSFKIINSGNQTLILDQPDISTGQAFVLSDLSSQSIPAQSEATFTITFTPTTIGNASATVSIPSNDANESPYTFEVSGKGRAPATGPDIEIRSSGGIPIASGDSSPNSADDTYYGMEYQGNTIESRTFVIANTGQSNLTDFNLSTSGDPVIISGTPSAIEAESESSFTISFPTNEVGEKNTTISIASNDPDESPYTFMIRLIVIPKPVPRITSFEVSGTTGVLTLDTVFRAQYRLTSSNRLNGIWEPVSDIPLIEGTGNPATIEVENLVTISEPKKFFRIEEVLP